jgi:hypothetical protein
MWAAATLRWILRKTPSHHANFGVSCGSAALPAGLAATRQRANFILADQPTSCMIFLSLKHPADNLMATAYEITID